MWISQTKEIMKLSFVFRFLPTLIAVAALSAFGQNIPAGPGVSITLSPENARDATLTMLPDGTAEIHVTGSTPTVTAVMRGTLQPAQQRVLALEYFSAHATDHTRLEFDSADGRHHVAQLAGLSHSEAFTTYTSDLSVVDGWGSATAVTRLGFESAPGETIRLRNIALRAPTAEEQSAISQRAELHRMDAVLQGHLSEYLGKSYAAEIANAYVDEKQVHVRGTVSSDQDVYLAEVPLYEDVTELKSYDYMIPVHAINGRFETTLVRFRTLPDHIYDRVYSRWMLVRKSPGGFEPISHAHYADDVKSQWSLPDEMPRSKKGLGGFSVGGPAQDLDDLGLTSVTVNLYLNFLRTSPGEDRIEFSYGGRTYYADRRAIEQYDKTLKYAAARKAIVAAILLVPKRSPHPEKDAPSFAYPHADPAGIYDMPDVASAEGLQLYTAAIHFLAERYSRPDEQYGRIHHWIMHNEVDAGWVWTNAGEKSELTYMDLYIKSMRAVYLTARQFNPHARVFISLTHFWNWTEDKHFYLPHHMLDELVQFSNAEGDFEWAIAYHPYPESLFKPRTWEDHRVDFTLNTPLITFKNIEVLDAWAKQPQTFYRKTKSRSIYLSEQGFNSTDYSAASLADQAAGLAYAWKKIEHLDTIEAMQYHNWIDNRGEGGLRIGLRKFRDEPGDPLGRKPIWSLYQKLGTPEEDAACDPYKKVVGITDWNSIRYHGPIGGVTQQSELRDLRADTWAATDALGRRLPGYAEVGSPRKRFVGIFYFLTFGRSGAPGPLNATEMIAKQPDPTTWPRRTYYWGQPEAGYYLSTDEWVIRRHARLLADAGVDVILFDTTNDRSHQEAYMPLLRVYAAMRAEGERTPQIAFLASQRSVHQVWDELYSKGLYRDLWFQWKGKPLLLTGQQRGMLRAEEMPEPFQRFFTIRQSWAWDSLPWFRDGRDQWPWVAHTPQVSGWSESPSRAEATPVAIAEHPLSDIGRSFHDGAEPATDNSDLTPVTAQGLYFQEQWNHALAVDPEFVFVTGWNEWTAGSVRMGQDVAKALVSWDFYPGAKLGRAGHPLKPGDVYFIDQYNEEFSRDAEPMLGGHTDDFYYQLVENIRRYKGVHAPEVASPATSIDLRRSFDQWSAVRPEFEDHAFDTLPRNSPGNFQAGPYVDTTGRNDIVSSKVARDAKTVFFYVKTRDPITSYKAPFWMLLLIDADQDSKTGWQGYDFVVNAKVINSRTTTIMRSDGSGHWIDPVRIPMCLEGNELMVSVPRELLKQSSDRVALQFHWADNIQRFGDVAEFFMHGDSAPDRRANYRYDAIDTPLAR